MPSQANATPQIISVSDESPGSPGLNIEDLNLPKSIVTRLAKGVLPPNTQIQSQAMLAMTKSATLFINYIASQANEYAVTAERKTVNPNDVFAALDDCEFGNWKPRLEAELQKYMEIRGQRKERLRSKDKDVIDKPVTKRQKRDISNDVTTENHDEPDVEDEPEPEDEADPEDDDQSEIGDEEIDGDATIEAEEHEGDTQLPDLNKEEPTDIEDPALEPADEALDNGDDSD